MKNWESTKFAFVSVSMVFADQMNTAIAKKKALLVESNEVSEVLEETLTSNGSHMLWTLKYLPVCEDSADDVLAPTPAKRTRKANK